MNIYFVEKFSEGDKDDQLEAMRKYFTLTDLENAEYIYCASISMMDKAIMAKRTSGKPLVTYCWDYYLWAHEGKHHDKNSWVRYAEMLKESDLVIVPSNGQKQRLKELLDVDSVVVRTGIKTYDGVPTDEGFILDPVRFYPEENRDWAIKAAQELNIPIVHSEHQFSLEEFRKLVLSCTFMTCAYREASTGGLTLMEGLWHGKPSLVSNSPYMGAKDYIGEFGNYFQFDSYEDLLVKMKDMWDNRKKIDTTKAREYMQKHFSFDAMANNLHKAICELKKN